MGDVVHLGAGQQARASGADNLGYAGAERLRDTILAYWKLRGHTPDVQICKESGALGGVSIWVVRSNLIRGLPPKKKRT